MQPHVQLLGVPSVRIGGRRHHPALEPWRGGPHPSEPISTGLAPLVEEVLA